jgi:hypothetical protein
MGRAAAEKRDRAINCTSNVHAKVLSIMGRRGCEQSRSSSIEAWSLLQTAQSRFAPQGLSR